MAHVTQAQAQACAHARSSESQRTDTHSHSVSLLFTSPLLLGSNEGVVTLQIVMHLKCSSMVGVDIDKKLIELANGRKSETLGYLLKNRQNASLEGTCLCGKATLLKLCFLKETGVVAQAWALSFRI